MTPTALAENDSNTELVAVNDTPTSDMSRNNPNSEIPNGGLVAWLQCAGSFCLFLNCWGVVNAFGVYQTFYEHNLLPEETSSRISWIGSIQAFLLVFIGVFTGPLFDHGYLRTLLITGSFGVVFGMMMTSLCNEYWQFVVAQGFVVGLGCGCLFVPCVAIIPSYFSTKKALAQGLAASGSSLGGIIYPILFQKLQTRIGFGWATRVMAFVILATLAIPIACMKMRVKPAAARRLIDISAWGEPPFSLFSMAELFGFMGLYVPFFYIQIYALEKTNIDENLAFYLLTFLNTGSFFGRILPNFLADTIGPMNVLIPCVLVSALLAFSWIGIASPAGVITFCFLYGFFSGSFVSLPPTIAFALSPSLGVVGVRSGTLFIPIALGLLVGNPIAGAVLRSRWASLQAFCGAMILLSGGLVIAARVAKVGRTFKARA